MREHRTPIFLMANLGSELSQLFFHKEQGERTLAESAARRGKNIIAELLAHPGMHGRRGEAEMLGEIIDDLLSLRPRFTVSREELEDYFTPLSLRVLKHAMSV